MAEKPNILIAVPAYGGEIKRLCAMKLVEICVEFERRKIPFQLATIDANDIAQVRNAFGTTILMSPGITHLLSIDNDMVPSAAGIFQMLEADRDFIGWVAPTRLTQPPSDRYVPNFYSLSPVRADSMGVSPVHWVGSGVLLIKRVVFERLASTGRIATQPKHRFNFNAPLYEFFTRKMIGDELASEDYSFCERWRELCGGEVFAYFGVGIGHIGEKLYDLPATAGARTSPTPPPAERAIRGRPA